jgi:hypothetical protein
VYIFHVHAQPLRNICIYLVSYIFAITYAGSCCNAVEAIGISLGAPSGSVGWHAWDSRDGPAAAAGSGKEMLFSYRE